MWGSWNQRRQRHTNGKTVQNGAGSLATPVTCDLQTSKPVTCDPTSFCCVGHAQLTRPGRMRPYPPQQEKHKVVTCDPTHTDSTSDYLFWKWEVITTHTNTYTALGLDWGGLGFRVGTGVGEGLESDKAALYPHPFYVKASFWLRLLKVNATL